MISLASALQYLIYPAAATIATWAVTSRKKDQATADSLNATAKKTEAEGIIAKQTVNAAVQLADINLLTEQIDAMNAAVTSERNARSEERESLTGRLQESDRRLQSAVDTIEELRQAQDHCQREILDFY